MNFYDYWILKTNISSNIKIKLLTQFKTTENIYKELIEKGNLSFVNINEHDKLTLTYRTLKDNFNIEEYNAILLKHKIKFVKYTDEKYPEKLKNIDSPPYGLFYKGNIEFTNDYCLSIIGTRNCTPYGEEVCKNIAKEISVNQVGIISGGARGIDILSHKVCLENNGIPICVLGSGLLNYYPKENAKYFDVISEKGCIISEYDIYTKPDKYNFPARNRIISALGDGLIVVEAKERSGTMITVRYALEYGKDIAAVPGPIYWANSKGCNDIIKDGAYIISSIDTLYEIFKLNKSKKSTLDVKYEKLFNNPSKYKVFSLIKNKPSNIDEIVNFTGIEIVDLYKILFELENLNIIESVGGNVYQAKIS